jgi:hypothetical protein
MYEFNPETLKWRKVHYSPPAADTTSDISFSIPCPRKGHTLTYIHLDRNNPYFAEKEKDNPNMNKTFDCLYLFGGINDEGMLLNDVWSFDLATKIWTQLVPHPSEPDVMNEEVPSKFNLSPHPGSPPKIIDSSSDSSSSSTSAATPIIAPGSGSLTLTPSLSSPQPAPSYDIKHPSPENKRGDANNPPIFPSPRAYHSTVYFSNTSAFVIFGGITSNNGVFNDYESIFYQLHNNQNSGKYPLYQNINHHGVILNDIWEFNIDTLHFSPIEVSSIVSNTSAVVGSKLVSISSIPSDNSSDPDGDASHTIVRKEPIFIPVSSNFRGYPGLFPSPRYGHFAIVSQEEGRMIIFGGVGGYFDENPFLFILFYVFNVFCFKF